MLIGQNHALFRQNEVPLIAPERRKRSRGMAGQGLGYGRLRAAVLPATFFVAFTAPAFFAAFLGRLLTCSSESFTPVSYTHLTLPTSDLV